MKEIHKSVLLQEAIDSLSLKEDDVAVDMTLVLLDIVVKY